MKTCIPVISGTKTGGVVVYLQNGQNLFFESASMVPKIIIVRTNGISFLNEEPKKDFQGDICIYHCWGWGVKI